MGLLQRLKTALGLDAGHSDDERASNRDEEGGVRVEREPDATTEAAVKGADDVAEAAEPAEPAEAAGPATQTDGPDADATPDGTDEADDGGGSTGDDRSVREISGIGPAYERRLNEAGVETVGELAAADAAALAEAADVAQGRVENWIDRARESGK